MRLFAELLYWTGRLEVIFPCVLIGHFLLVYALKRNSLPKRWLYRWSILFAIASAGYFLLTFDTTHSGLDYTRHHLFNGGWKSSDEALTNMLARWQHLLAPIYVPWLVFWIAGWFVMARFMRPEETSPLDSVKIM
jgi:hypothetical protein